MTARQGRRVGTPIVVGMRSGGPATLEGLTIREVTDDTRGDAWRALCHASRGLPDGERVAWLRDMRDALGLVDPVVREPGRCACGAPIGVVNISRKHVRQGMCGPCDRAGAS